MVSSLTTNPLFFPTVHCLQIRGLLTFASISANKLCEVLQSLLLTSANSFSKVSETPYSMNMDMRHGHGQVHVLGHAAWTWTFRIYIDMQDGQAACTFPCCLSITMLYVHVQTDNWFSGCMSTSLLYVQVHAACPCHCYKQLNIQHGHGHAAWT